MGNRFPRSSPTGSRTTRLLPLLPLLLLACRPDLLGSVSSDDPSSDAALPPSALGLTLDPPAPPTAAPAVLRLRLTASGHTIDAVRLALVQGAAGPAQLRQVRRGEISATLAKRLIPTQAWWEDAKGEPLPAQQLGAVLVVAPERALTPGEAYALIIGEPATIFDLHIAPDDPVPLLARLWPPLGASASDRVGVWCGDADLPLIEGEMRLAPSALSGHLRRGLPGNALLAQRCLHFQAPPGPALDAPGLPVPQLDPASGPLRLDPRPFLIDADPRPLTPIACLEGEQPFGPGCARVSDDRLEVRAPAAPALWAIGGEGLDRTLATVPDEPFVLSGLPPSSAITLDVTALDNEGRTTRQLFATSTLPPSPHLVLNEVLANPLGPEPQQEWVELCNDGALPVDLDGYVLADVG
ncbi:MAG: hypothetical protein ABI193_00840, partial [Minicystis sp.]